jgi:hypothetical protein
MLQPIVDASPAFAAYLDAGIPAGRLGTPGDVAGAATWLADSTKSAYVTGIALPVDSSVRVGCLACVRVFGFQRRITIRFPIFIIQLS